MARLVLLYFYYMETLDHTIFSCLAPFFCQPCVQREKKTSEYCNFFAFADGRNQTRAVCAASKCTIHYTIAFRQNNSLVGYRISLAFAAASSPCHKEKWMKAQNIFLLLMSNVKCKLCQHILFGFNWRTIHQSVSHSLSLCIKLLKVTWKKWMVNY